MSWNDGKENKNPGHYFAVKPEPVEHVLPKYLEEYKPNVKAEFTTQSISYVKKEFSFGDAQIAQYPGAQHLPLAATHTLEKAELSQSNIPFDPKEMELVYKAYNSADEIVYTPESALQEGVAMVKDISNSLKRIELGSKLRKDVWMKEIETLLKQKTPRTLVAVCGATGAGKSSLLNAVLDDNIVPTSGMRACTAVITEISYHKKKTIEADISFLSKEEWKSELAILLDDMVEEDGSLRRFTDMRSDAGIAWHKVHAVYPLIKPQDLLKMDADQIIRSHPDTARILGTIKKITASDSKKFSEHIGKYIDSKDKKRGSDKDKKNDKERLEKEKKKEAEPALWPLIRLVQVQCHSDALSKGAVLVDLPGVADANAYDSTTYNFNSVCTLVRCLLKYNNFSFSK